MVLVLHAQAGQRHARQDAASAIGQGPDRPEPRHADDAEGPFQASSRPAIFADLDLASSCQRAVCPCDGCGTGLGARGFEFL